MESSPITMKFPSFSFVLLLAHVTIADLPPPGKCYWPNGDKAPENYIQCPGRKNCCASGESCLTNNLCYAAHLNVAYRGACADKTWPLSGCPRVCYTGQYPPILTFSNLLFLLLITYIYILGGSLSNRHYRSPKCLGQSL